MSETPTWGELLTQAAVDVAVLSIVAALVIGGVGWVLVFLYSKHSKAIVRLCAIATALVVLLLLGLQLIQLNSGT